LHDDIEFAQYTYLEIIEYEENKIIDLTEIINDEYLEDNFSSNSNNDNFSDNSYDSEFDDIYLSDNFPNNESLSEYDFSEYDNFSDNYG
ncbi:46204_t:CDS:2, partial [Gigaspora margarita]